MGRPGTAAALAILVLWLAMALLWGAWSFWGPGGLPPEHAAALAGFVLGQVVPGVAAYKARPSHPERFGAAIGGAAGAFVVTALLTQLALRCRGECGGDLAFVGVVVGVPVVLVMGLVGGFGAGLGASVALLRARREDQFAAQRDVVEHRPGPAPAKPANLPALRAQRR